MAEQQMEFDIDLSQYKYLDEAPLPLPTSSKSHQEYA